jgi:hypothetical protein
MSKSLHASAAVSPVQRLDDVQPRMAKVEVQNLDSARNLPEIPLQMAKAQIGAALKKTIQRTDSVLKDFGDSSLVDRFCKGDVPSVFARAWARKETRRELI